MTQPISYIEELKRKAVHLSSFWMVAATLILPELIGNGGRYVISAIFALLLLLTLVSEHSFANGGRYLGRLYGILFGKMLRNEVKPGQWVVSGGAPVLAAALLVNLIFPPPIAAGSLGVMLAGDAAAALVGRKFGRHKLVNGKSLEGSLAFIIAASVVLYVILYISRAGVPCGCFYLALPAILLAAAAELFTKQIKIDDNFTIPLSTGAVLALAFIF